MAFVFGGLARWISSISSHQVFRIQKRTLKSLYGLKPRDSCKEYFTSGKILTIALPVCFGGCLSDS